MTRLFPILGLLALAGCGVSDEDRIDRLNPAGWPDSLAVIGEGFPDAGDPCRQLGNTDAISRYAGELIDLVGCPTVQDANALEQGRIVGDVDGYTIVALDREPEEDADVEDEGEVGPMEGVAYGNVGSIYCEGRGYGGSSRCQAGIRSEPGPGGVTMIDIVFPNGNRRTLMFDGAKLVDADSSEEDGSAGWDISVRRQNGRQYVSHGPERFIILDSFLGIEPPPAPTPQPDTDPLAPLEPPPPPVIQIEGVQ
ncbi:hypothetical protein [Sphingomicrobium flavum]|uniref:hypothetical protein n=1 Tax=Sphingomicrobium flavum TaxID=1229164 RepID=UPI0021AD914D|nr:hypothetical protein [Sphingomicrobium flavum]